jgi:hypothetical protein
MSRKKVILLSLVVFCVIGAITALVVDQREEPRNVFEEMYYADSKFKHADFAEFEGVENMPISNDDRIKNWIEVVI